jgi:beta-glucosidase
VVIPEIAERSAALLGSFAAANEAVLDVVFGRFQPQAKPPFEFPRPMEAMRRQKQDVPCDSEQPPFGSGHRLSDDSRYGEALTSCSFGTA